MLPRAVLFDLDGTLIDSIPLIVASMRHAFDGHFRGDQAHQRRTLPQSDHVADGAPRRLVS
jgi:phosphoglycolate phosphatase-like HAD superfamily hydrolase